MKKFLQFTVLLIAFLAVGKARASHVMGSDITYKCLGNGKYEVTLTAYRDCNGITLSNSPVTYKCASGTGSGQVNLTQTSLVDITGIEPKCNQPSRCSGNYPYGIHEYTFVGIVDLSALNCCEIILGWEQCCRNGAITTGAANQNFYTEARLNKCVTPCNSSPKFTSKPTALICLGQDFIFNNGALDTIDNGDSLSYTFLEPLSAQGSTIGYSGQWSSVKPITFLGFPNAGLNFPAGFHLDSSTGDIAFRPAKKDEVTVLVLEVKEWRKVNGVMTVIGITRRDIQIIVRNCPDNKVPKLSGQNKVGCSGQTVCVEVKTDDEDKDDTVVISWNKGIPKAVFSHTNNAKRLSTGSVCWTPTENDVSTIPYTFTITAKDNACDIPGQAIRAFSITVKGSPQATRTLKKLACGMVAVDYTPLKNYPGLTSTWDVRDSNNKAYFKSTKKQDTLRMQPGKNFAYLILKSNECISTYVDTVIIDPYVRIDLPSDTVLCAGNPMTLDAVTTYGKPTYNYNWSHGPTTKTVTINPSKDSLFYVTVTDGEGCFNSDTVRINWSPLPPLNVGPDARICFDASQQLTSGNDTMTLKYLWSTGDTIKTITVKDSNEYILRVTDSVGCKNFDTMMLKVTTVPVSGGPNQRICDKDTAQLTATGADSYSWYVVPNVTTPAGSGANFNLTITADKEVHVRAQRTYGGVTCVNADTVMIFKNPLPIITFVPLPTRCVTGLNGNPYPLSNGLSNTTLSTGNWVGITKPQSVSNNWFYPDSAGPGTLQLRYSVTDGNGCKNSAVTTTIVSPLPPTVVTDGSYCAYDGLQNLRIKHMSALTQSVSGGKTWTVLDPSGQPGLTQQGPGNYFFNVSAVPQLQTYRLVLRVFANNCENFDTAAITVREVPIVRAGIFGQLCQNDAAIDLDLAGNGTTPGGGIWSQPVNGKGLQGGHFFNPDLPDSNFSQNKVYYKYDIPGNNCPVTDSAIIIVKPRPNVKMTPINSVCSDTGSINLNKYATPAGGVWSGTGGIAGNGQFNTTTSGSGTFDFVYNYTAPSTGCKHSNTNKIFVQEQPTLVTVIPDAACEGIPYTLEATYTGASGIRWDRLGDGYFDSDPTATFSLLTKPIYQPGQTDNATQTFTITVRTTGNGFCQAKSKTYKAKIEAIPTAEILATPIVGCEPLLVNFTASTNQAASAVYTWNFGDANSGANNTSAKQRDKHLYENQGDYNVTLNVTNSLTKCTKDAKPVSIKVHPTPDANFKMSRKVTTVAATDISFNNLTVIDAPGIIKEYTWEFGDADLSESKAEHPAFTYPTDTGKYVVKLTAVTDQGCESIHMDTLIINPDITVFVPNAFTPNLYGPTRNNRFYVNAEGYLTFEIFIFNRWGEKVYYSENIQEGWDGMFKGEFAQQDVYTYVVNVTSFSGKEYSFYGTVTLLR